MILLYFYFIFLLFLAYIIHTNETLFINYFKQIPSWEPINNKSNSQNLFITNQHKETDLTSSIQNCIKESYTSNVLQEYKHTYTVAIYKNSFETVFSINIYKVNYDSLLQLLDNNRLNKINLTDPDPKNILLMEFEFHSGDLLSYHECIRYFKNSYEHSIEKSKSIHYKQDLSLYTSQKSITLKYDNSNPYHIPFIISMLHKNKNLGLEQFKTIYDMNMNNFDNRFFCYQLLSLMLQFFSIKRIKYHDIPV